MNNDRFKVRVWNVSGGYYLPEFYLTPAGEVCEFGVFNGTPMVRKFDSQGNYQKERCTGLRDRNNKLIYEGDILNDGEEISVVAWDEECYILEYPDGSIGEFALWCKRFAVIGTIHDEQFRDVAKMIEEKE